MNETDRRLRNENRHKSHQISASLDYCLEVFGDHLAAQHGYTELDGFDAVRYYLMQKHHWLPAQVRALTTEDMRFALSQEMSNWTLPPAAVF